MLCNQLHRSFSGKACDRRPVGRQDHRGIQEAARQGGVHLGQRQGCRPGGGHRWVIADPDDENFGEIASFVSKDDFFDQLLDSDSKITKVGDKLVNGVDCVGLKGKKSTFYFDKNNGLPVSLVTATTGSGSLDFTYDEIDEAVAPTADESVDLAEITG